MGGGYPDDGLSYVPLEWMMTGAQKAGVRFCKEIWHDYRALSDENGPIHDSRQVAEDLLKSIELCLHEIFVLLGTS